MALTITTDTVHQIDHEVNNTTKEVSKLFYGRDEVWPKEDNAKAYVKFSCPTASHFYISISSWNCEAEFSRDGENWEEFDPMTDDVFFGGEYGDFYFRVDGGIETHTDFRLRPEYETQYPRGGNVKVSGSLAALNNYKNLSVGGTGDFESTFYGMTTISDASELVLPQPSRPLHFANLFAECSSLISPPALPFTYLAESCYEGMFAGTALRYTPELPAKILAAHCYQRMFANCKQLYSGGFLPAPVLQDSCYYEMFAGCTALTREPNIQATQVASDCCYSMFEGCTSLVQSPVLFSRTLSRYCYGRMFAGCTNIQYVHVFFEYWFDEATEHWLDGTSGGTLQMPIYLSPDRDDVSRIPYSWNYAQFDPMTL